MRCHDCWYDTDLCVCGRPNDDIELASAYILVASAPLGLHHPKDVGLAEEWVRRLSAAWKAIGITADHATHLLRD